MKNDIVAFVLDLIARFNTDSKGLGKTENTELLKLLSDKDNGPDESMLTEIKSWMDILSEQPLDASTTKVTV